MNTHLAKLNKILRFLNRTKQIYKVDIHNKPKNINKKVNEFCNSSG